MARQGSDRVPQERIENDHREKEAGREGAMERRMEGRRPKPVTERRQMENRFREKMDLSDAERRACREKRAETVERMVQKDFDISPEKSRNDARNFHYRNSREFDGELRKREPHATEIQRTEGFYHPRDNQAYVRDTGNTLERATHEKLHQKSKSELPTRLDEGVTEHFTRKELGAFADLKTYDTRGREITKPGSDYQKDARVVGKLEAVVGRETLSKAYFEGKTDVLKTETDRALGNGAFEQLSETLEKRDYERANQLF